MSRISFSAANCGRWKMLFNDGPRPKCVALIIGREFDFLRYSLPNEMKQSKSSGWKERSEDVWTLYVVSFEQEYWVDARNVLYDEPFNMHCTITHAISDNSSCMVKEAANPI